MISIEDEGRIIRLYHVEKWKIGAIAGEMRVHHSVIRRVLDRVVGSRAPVGVRPSRLDPYREFLLQKIAEHPRITASRLFGMARERGYQGSPDHFRHAIAKLRPRRTPEPFLRIKTLAGEEAQVDWAYFGHIEIGRARRQLMAFVMVLSYSRRLFVRFFPGQTTTWFLLGHVLALEEFGGCPRRMLYDNLKSAVLDRRGDAIQFNPDLLALAMHYRFEPRPVGVRKGNEKGRVERAIRYVRGAFFEALEWRTLEELNAKAAAFCNGQAMDRKWPEDDTLTVRQAVAEEAPMLLPLPAASFPAFDRVDTSARKTPYIRYDLNDYSIPHDRIGRALSVVASADTVRILDGTAVIAEHVRSFDKGKVIEDQAHVDAVKEMKRRARKGAALDRLARCAPESTTLLKQMAERSANIGTNVFTLMKMLDQYGVEDLRLGIAEALRRGVPHPHAVRQAIERRREESGAEPVLPLDLPDDPRLADLDISPHDLSDYDEEEEDEEVEEAR